MVPRLKKGLIPVISAKKIPNEARIVGILVLLLAALYIFQLISQPAFLKSQVNAVTGLVVSDNEQQHPDETTTKTTATAAEEETKPKVSTQASQQQAQQPKPAATPGVPIKIVSPPKGSTQAPGFDVTIEVSSQVLQCYYSVKDNSQFTWDRRLKPCKTALPVAAEHCKTSGANTCRVEVEAWSSDGNLLGTDSAYYGIR